MQPVDCVEKKKGDWEKRRQNFKKGAVGGGFGCFGCACLCGASNLHS